MDRVRCLCNTAIKIRVYGIIVVLLCLLPSFAHAALVLRTNTVTVKVGRTVFLSADDIVIRKSRKNDEGCRIEVVQNDPITQRVGVLQPKIFDCQYQANIVQFIHSGSPFLTEDRVKLRVHRFTSRRTISETFHLNVRIINATADIVVTRGLRHVIVPEFNGISNTIDTSVMLFNNSRSSNASCIVSFNQSESNWPLVGHMIAGGQRVPVRDVRTTCQEFLYMELQYEHLQKPTPDVDYLVLSIELTDPKVSDVTIAERFFLPIYIKNALLNSQPRSSSKSMYTMEVDQFVLTPLIKGIISAEDYETPDSLLVYNITKPPRPDQGHFVHLDDQATPITSFLQRDLENQKIAYRAPNISLTERPIYEVEFKVYDSHFYESMPIVLHIAVRPSSQDIPRITVNTGLVILEGQSRDISSEEFMIAANNPGDVRVYVMGGLEHGQLLRDGRLTVSFTIADLENGALNYIHDDSESVRDYVLFKISDGKHDITSTFPINVITKDDSAPSILWNLGMELNEGQTQRLDTSMLLAHDIDSVDSSIVYVVTQPTDAGEIIRKTRPTDSGTRVNRFSQRELRRGQIYYRHFGRENFHDEFLFTLQDQQVPPNESAVETFYIAINPVNENPPQLSPDATRLMRVSESDIALITKTELEYIGTETSSEELTYVITAQPYFVYRNRAMSVNDAGRIIALHNRTLHKQDGIPAVETFNQRDINNLKIGYMPPMADIGPEPRLVRFVYTVQDSSGNKVLGQQFDIDVQPVNDRPPTFVTSHLLVEEGGILGISTNHVSAVDVDTYENDLVFIIDQPPHHGQLQKGGVNLAATDTFKMLDLRRKDLRYIHDGSEVTSDFFTLSVSDGDNRVSKVCDIEVVPVDDVAPRVKDDLRTHLIVSEGSQTVITSNVLAATDDKTDDLGLMFLIVKQPKYGMLQLRGEPATKFSQQDVKTSLVHYIHTSGEIGPEPIKDTVTFIVSDQHYKTGGSPPTYVLNITITPVDNQSPIIISGLPINIEEGKTFYFSPDYLTVKDADTEPNSIQFVITKHPQWGYLDNSRSKRSAEKTVLPVTSFKLQDIIDNIIAYVQSTHKGIEPTSDSFDFYASDGKSKSLTHTATIRITPINDEEPNLMLTDFTVVEGGSKIIDKVMIDANDLDMPRDDIRLFISQAPEHGDIVVVRHTPNGAVEATVNAFSSTELERGMQLKYIHDDTENFADKFAVTASDGKHEVKKVCNITVIPINDERPEIVRNTGLQMGFGERAVITNQLLFALDRDNADNQVIYIVLTVPKKGALQMCTLPNEPMFSQKCRDMWVGQNFTQASINEALVRYVHTASMGNSESDSFMFALSDGKNKRQVETFHIRVVNNKRAKITLTNEMLALNEGDRLSLTTRYLSADDGSSRPEEIVFAIIRPPHLGQIEYIETPLIPITSFTQSDLVAGRVVYNHLTKVDIKNDSFTFTVANGHGDNKDTEFMFSVTPSDRFPPSLAVNELVQVLQGAEIAITVNNLRADDPDTDSSNVTFMIAKQPTYGRLYNRGVYITNLFTQNAIDRGMITYESDGSHAGLDNFLFTLSDNKNDGFLFKGNRSNIPVSCNIYIQPLVNDIPKLITLEHPTNIQMFEEDRYGFRLNSNVLKAVDSDTMNKNLVFIIEQRPKFGHLENSEAKRYVRERFTQRDLDEDTLQYIIDTSDRETNDSFTFRIQDVRGNVLEDQRMEFHWSFVDLERSSMVVCENIGTLPVTLVRTGDLSTHAFVGIEVQDRNTRLNEDYRTSSDPQVQFEPGKATATWNIQILDEGPLESSENFMVIIKEPVHAILGKRRKLRVRLINAENGECPQYLGMVSKHQTSIPDTVFLPDNDPVTDDDVIVPEKETILSASNLNRNNRQRPQHENALMDPAGNGMVDQFPESAGNTNAALSPEERTQKRLEERQRKLAEQNRNNSNRKRRNRRKGGGLKNNKAPAPVQVTTPRPEVTTSVKVDIKAPQNCTQTTGGLLYFDPITKQMYKCNGVAWFLWRPESKDQQVEAKECQQGWSKYGSRCFRFINERLTWEVSEMLCQMSYGAHLASVVSEEHLRWMSEIGGRKAFWIGLNAENQTGSWRYTNGEAVSYTRWKGEEPRVKRTLSRKNCVIVDKKRRMRNKPCASRKARLMCEQDIVTKEPVRAPPKRDISSISQPEPERREKNRLKKRKKNDPKTPRRNVNGGFFYGA